MALLKLQSLEIRAQDGTSTLKVSCLSHQQLSTGTFAQLRMLGSFVRLAGSIDAVDRERPPAIIDHILQPHSKGVALLLRLCLQTHAAYLM